MYPSPAQFAAPAEADVTRLVLEHPLAWLVTSTAGDFGATPLPLRPVLDDAGAITLLRGHFARSNPQLEAVQRSPRALVLFTGPHGYISSSWLRDRTRTPTWNYAVVQYLVDVELTEDAARTDAQVRDMVDAMEQHRSRPWSVDEMGERYRRLRNGVVAFDLHIRERYVKFKLGQDERDSEYLDIMAALADADPRLREWMLRANGGRGG